jgi:hypothetical protein
LKENTIQVATRATKRERNIQGVQRNVRRLISILALIFAATACFAGVTVSAPASGATVGSPTHFVASATGSTTIASMIVYVDGNQDYLVYSNSVDTYINLGAGGHTAVVRAWDNWGGVYSQTVNFSVGAASTSTAPAPSSGGGAGVFFSSPANGATVGSPVQVTASGTSSGSSPINAMILYVDGNEAYRTYSSSMNTAVSMGSGTHSININAWDNNGQLYQSAHETITVGSGGSTATPTPTPTSTSSSGAVGVTFNSPSNGASVGSPFTVSATARPSGSAPISSMILYMDGNQQYLTYSGNLSTSVSAGAGTHTLVINSWDNNGQLYTAKESVTVGSGGGGTTTTSSSSTGGSPVTAGSTVYGIQTLGSWSSCSDCAGANGAGPIAGYSMEQHQGSPSLSGDATKFSIWGSTPYSDVLWWKSLSNAIGNTAAPHHFIYDTYFYGDNPARAEAIEFDINQFVNGHSLIFGTQCNIGNGNVWDIWDNQASRWVHTSASCPTPSAYTWHHVTIEVERANDGGDWLHYISITQDGNKKYIDAWYPPSGTSWTGITVNFQMDGNYAQQPYSIWLDKFSFSYY